jgi:methylthioribose-1-phosphate isomerase
MSLDVLQPLRWDGEKLSVLDQTRLPNEVCVIDLPDLEAVCEAIGSLRVRGAPCIGLCAAFGIVQEMRRRKFATLDEARTAFHAACTKLRRTRPTAVNLHYALQRLEQRQSKVVHSLNEWIETLEVEAQAMWHENDSACRAIAEYGLSLLKPGMSVVTYCNTGVLATASVGTALAPILRAHEAGMSVHVYICETRPLLQGARLTAWELYQAGVPHTLICDNAAAFLMKKGYRANEKIGLVLVGADRIARNGDTANKIGTYALALAARAHQIPFFVAAPWSTFDMTVASGQEIPIEMRNPEEVRTMGGYSISPQETAVWNPAFDVTPAELIDGFITERGILRPPFPETPPHRSDHA